MNILILGLGSIGQRHLRNLIKIDKKIKFFALRKKFLTPLLNNKNHVIRGDIKRRYKIQYIKNLEDIKRENIAIDAAFICTPSKFHVKESIWLLKNNINIFVEKPLGSSLENIKKLEKILSKKKSLKNMMGYQLKFNPIINKVKNLIKENYIGKINNIFVHHGEHIDNFHPYEDYRISYAARKDLGGGVILVQIHEIDYIMFIFEDYKLKVLNSLNSKVSKLSINVEDNVIANFLLSKKNKKAVCTLHLNFFERPKNRKILIIGEQGKIEADLNKGKIILNKNTQKKEFNFKFDRNKIFIKQIRYFINCVKKNKKIDKKYDLKNGIRSLKIALELKKNEFRK